MVTVEMLEAAQRLAGLEFTPDELERLAERLNGPGDRRRDYERLRAANLGNSQQPAIVFNPVPPGMTLPAERGPNRREPVTVSMPAERRGPGLPARHASRAARRDAAGQAVGADRALPGPVEAARSEAALRGQLHRGHRPPPGTAGRRGDRGGDLPRTPARHSVGHQGPPRRCGARGPRGAPRPTRDQVIDTDATVYRRLTDAGAILVAKLTMGALASGDRWFGGRTRSPWNLEQGSSGSSAGPGAATAAGLVGFSIGTETRGSIISPSTRKRGHRPASDVRPGKPVRGDDPELDHGQDRADVPLGRGLRPRVRGHPGAGRARQHPVRRAVQLGRGERRRRPAGRLPAVGVRGRGRKRGREHAPDDGPAADPRQQTAPPST